MAAVLREESGSPALGSWPYGRDASLVRTRVPEMCVDVKGSSLGRSSTLPRPQLGTPLSSSNFSTGAAQAAEGGSMEYVRLDIYFEWSTWTSWDMIFAFRRHQARGIIPPLPGVYEIRRTDAPPGELLYIGSARKLTTRVYDHLLGNGKRAAQKKQALLEEVSHRTELLALRWAVTEEFEYVALERYLINEYRQNFGEPPKYVVNR